LLAFFQECQQYRCGQDAFVGDAIEHRVSWSGGSAFDALRGETVRLVFRLCGADLYSFAQRGL